MVVPAQCVAVMFWGLPLGGGRQEKLNTKLRSQIAADLAEFVIFISGLHRCRWQTRQCLRSRGRWRSGQGVRICVGV